MKFAHDGILQEALPLKLNETMKGLSALYRFDRNSKGGGLLFYIREDIPSKNVQF